MAAVAGGVLVTAALLMRRPSPPPAVATASAPKSTAVGGGAMAGPAVDAAAVSPAEQRLPGNWVDWAPTERPAAGTETKVGGPLVIGLHGRGDTPEQFSNLAARLGPAWSWRLLKAPLPWREHTQWFQMDAADGGKADLAAAVALLDAHVRSARGRKLALVGFSQGCMLAAHYVATQQSRGERAADAVLCLSGALPHPVQPQASPAPSPPAMLMVHGTDDAIVPVDRARDAVRQLAQAGVPAELREHAEGHNIPDALLPSLQAWLHAKLQ